MRDEATVVGESNGGTGAGDDDGNGSATEAKGWGAWRAASVSISATTTRVANNGGEEGKEGIYPSVVRLRDSSAMGFTASALPLATIRNPPSTRASVKERIFMV